jgi:hypothetical protein
MDHEGEGARGLGKEKGRRRRRGREDDNDKHDSSSSGRYSRVVRHQHLSVCTLQRFMAFRLPHSSLLFFICVVAQPCIVLVAQLVSDITLCYPIALVLLMEDSGKFNKVAYTTMLVKSVAP